MKTNSKISFRMWSWGLLLGAMVLGMALGAIPHADTVFAAASDLLDDNDRPNAAVSSEFRDAVRGFLNYFLAFLGLLCVIFIVYAGILMVTAGGDDEQTGKGKKILLWAGAGLIVVMLSFAIVKLFVRAGDAVT